MKPSLLVISFSNFNRDPRVFKQILALRDQFAVTEAGFAPSGLDNTDFVKIDPSKYKQPSNLWRAGTLAVRAYERHYSSIPAVRSAREALAGKRFDLILANDVSALPVALEIGDKVVLDAHEYSPREFDERLDWRLLMKPFWTWVCKRYLPRTKGMVTVCNAIAQEYKSNFGILPGVVTNAPLYRELKPSPVHSGAIRMVHHGAAVPSRRLESMIEAMNLLDERFSLDLILVPGVQSYLDQIADLASRTPRVRMLEPVPTQQLPEKTNHYDIGLYVLPPANFNARYALPNKFFEFLQARLALVIGPSVEMASLVGKYGCGVVTPGFSPRDMALALSGLDAAKLDAMKARADIAARDLCFEKQSSILMSTLHGALQR